MLRLRLDAPFAVCRTFSAGWYRPTTTFLTPTAAYGLILNIARIETRLPEHDADHDGSVPASLIRGQLPRMRIALGAPSAGDEIAAPSVHSLYQQLHNYPVGSASGTSSELSRGNKNNITPVRRELLHRLRAVILVDAGAEIETRLLDGLAGQLNQGRYGLPFVGDNNFLPDRLEPLRSPIPTFWYELIRDQVAAPRPRTTRLTEWIDRADMSKTISHLYAPTELATLEPPPAAWTEIPPVRSS